MTVAAALSTRVVASASDLPPRLWDSLGADGFFASSSWLASVERWLSPPPAYVLVYEAGEPVAGLVAYLVEPGAYATLDPVQVVLQQQFLADLARFQSADDAESTRILAARLHGELADGYPIAVCACPYACAAGVVGPARRRDVAEALADAFAEVAAGWDARGSAFLYVDERRRPALAEALRGRGALPVTLAARCVLPVRWRSLEEYVSSLPSRRRANVRRELRDFAARGLRASVVERPGPGELAGRLAPLFAAHEVKYGEDTGIEGARETISWIEACFGDVTTVVVIEHEGRPVAFHLFYEVGDTFYSYIVGQTYDAPVREGFAFFHAVFYEPIRLATERGIRRIDFGLDSYEAKRARGCDCERLTGFFELGEEAADDLAALFALVDAAQAARFPPVMHEEAAGAPWP